VVTTSNGGDITTRGWIFDHDFPEGAEEIAAFNGKTVVARIANVVISGVNFQYSTASTLEFWRNTLAKSLTITQSVETSGNYIYASLLNSPNGSLLTAVNVNGDPTPTEIHLKDANLTFTVELAPHEARVIPINTTIGEYAIIYSTSEIFHSQDSQNWLLGGTCGTTGEIVFAKQAKISLDGTPCELQPHPLGYILRYEHAKTPLKISFA
jgi:hypothetical protein